MHLKDETNEVENAKGQVAPKMVTSDSQDEEEEERLMKRTLKTKSTSVISLSNCVVVEGIKDEETKENTTTGSW